MTRAHSLCTYIELQDYSPGTHWLSMNLTCPAAAGRTYHHHAEMNMVVHWQSQPWARQAAAWGPGLRHASAGQEASFTVQMVTRAGRNASVGGDYLQAHLAGPAVITAAVTDLGDGTYHFRYIPWDAGVYTLEVMVTYLADRALADPFWRLDGTYLHPRDIVYAHVHSSPFTVAVAPYAPGGGGGEGEGDAGGGRSARRGDEGALGGPWAPYKEEDLPVCNREQSLSAQGRWIDRDRCVGRGSPQMPHAWQVHGPR